MEHITVFISYSWDSEDHKEWVLSLANRLRSDGIDVILDRYYLRPGKNLPFFVEDSLRKSKRIIIVLTPNYKLKAEKRLGGVGQEFSMINNELLKNVVDNQRIIPLLKEGNQDLSIPEFLQQYIFINFSQDSRFENQYEELVREIFDEPKIRIPELGKKPLFNKKEEAEGAEKKREEPNSISKIVEYSKNLTNSSYTKRKETAAEIFELATSVPLVEIVKLIDSKDINQNVAAAICLKSYSDNMGVDMGSNPNVRRFVSFGISHESSFLRYRVFDLISVSEILKSDFYSEIERQLLKENNEEVQGKINSILNIKPKPSSDSNESIKNEIKERIASGDVVAALEVLATSIKESDKLYNQIIMLKAQFKHLQTQNFSGIISLDDYSMQLNRINYGILNLIDDIK